MKHAQFLFVIILLSFGFKPVHAQFVLDFDVTSSACRNQLIDCTNTSAEAFDYEWDFCSGDLSRADPTVTQQSFSGLSVPVGTAMLKFQGNWYGFVTNVTNNTITRINFGSDLMNNAPQIINLGNLGGLLSGPQDIKPVIENDQIFLFVSNRTVNKLIRINLGGNINNTSPTTDILLSGNGDINNNGVEVVFNGLDWIVFYTSQQSIRILRLTGSLSSMPTASDIMVTSNISGVNGIGDITIINYNGNWYGLIVGYTSRTVHRLSFGTDLFSNPVSTNITSSEMSSYIPQSIQWKTEGAKNYGFISTSSGDLIRLDFTGSVLDSYTFNVLGKFDMLVNTFKIDIANEGSLWRALTPNWLGNRIFFIDFPNPCSSDDQTSTAVSPALSYSLAGNYLITLSASDNNGNRLSVAKGVAVSSFLAPTINFTFTDNVCVNSNVTMFSTSDKPILSYEWDFDDGENSSDNSPTHHFQYASIFKVRLSVTDQDACNNYIEKSISIYDEPIPNFQIPTSVPLCSNQNYLFYNTSVTDPGYPVTWQWKVNDVDESSTEDLLFSFTEIENQTITLAASIPGCENEITKNIPTLTEGPLVDFTMTGQCEDDLVVFTNNTQGDITAYSWNFDDGQNSTDTNPTHVFSDIGVYDVTLTASNTTTGCNNTETKPITIYSKPEVNFLLSPPPFSCDGTPAQFNDLTPNPTDSNIASWAWNFDDTGSSDNTSTLKNPQHTYANAGDYNVSLLVTTNFFCSATIQLPVTISQSPVADFTHEPACEDIPVNFSDTSTGTIDSWDWMIGATAYTTQNPTHTFNNSGNTSATLIVTATNNCIGSVSKPIVVPVKLTPDFSVARNCVNQQTLFTDITNSTADPVSSQNWSFGMLGTTSGSPVEFTFSNTGGVNVSLTITTQTGCVYPVSKLVNITSSPQANFTPSPLAGAPPLAVQFTNTSVNATSYQWAFHDQNNSTSSAVSPTFVYQNLGEYQAELTAANAQNCFHKTSKTIRVVMPFVDVALGGLELMEFQNGFKPAVTIFNRGNVPVINLALLLNISGPVIRERVNAIIIPNTSYRYVLSFEFPSTDDIDYFCIEAEVTDTSPDDNEVCLSPDQSFISFPPYPNPSKGLFQLDWITKEAGIVNLTLVNSMGQEEKNLQIESDEGLNPFILETQGLSAGVYFVKIKYLKFTKVYRVFVSE